MSGPLPEAEANRRKEAIARYVGLPNWGKLAANDLGISSHRLRKWATDNGLIPESSVVGPDLPPPQEQEPLSVRQERRFRDKINELQKKLNEAARQLNAREDIRATWFGLSDPIQPHTFSLKGLNKSASKRGEIPVLLTSDFQWGEVIKLNEMGGLNAFNSQIASDRYRRLIERTIDMVKNHHAGAPAPAFYYLRGGDALSGGIHEELADTDDQTPITAAIDLIKHEQWGIQKIHDELGVPVVVISVSGNHDRITKKPRTKGYTSHSFDTFISYALEAHFAGNKDITFLTPTEPDALFRVYDHQFLLTHGDQIGSSGGQGFIGPAATITRGMKKTVDYYASIGAHIDTMLVGHFHTYLELEYGYANGSLPGYSEYARGRMRARPKPPLQLLLHVHPTRGITSARKILVGGDGEGLLCQNDGSPAKLSA